jgi:hypothetical protein
MHDMYAVFNAKICKVLMSLPAYGTTNMHRLCGFQYGTVHELEQLRASTLGMPDVT